MQLITFSNVVPWIMSPSVCTNKHFAKHCILSICKWLHLSAKSNMDDYFFECFFVSGMIIFRVFPGVCPSSSLPKCELLIPLLHLHIQQPQSLLCNLSTRNISSLMCTFLLLSCCSRIRVWKDINGDINGKLILLIGNSINDVFDPPRGS